MTNSPNPPTVGAELAQEQLQMAKIFLPPELYRAYQRGIWLAVQETGRSQLSLMAEMVEDFLVKYGN